MTYELNFEKIKETSKDKTIYMKGVYWDSVPTNAPYLNHVLDLVNKKNIQNNTSFPILHINEAIQEHFTQILFILQESFTTNKFTGWKSFTKDYLNEICKKDYVIYCTDPSWPNGKQFVKEFPKKINYFLENFCNKI